MPDVEGGKPTKREFKSHPLGYLHIDLAEVRTEDGKLCRRVTADFLQHVAAATPYKIHTVLTDHGTHFTDPTGDGWTPGDIKAMRTQDQTVWCHAFEAACADLEVQHRLTKPRHPSTTGPSRTRPSSAVTTTATTTVASNRIQLSQGKATNAVDVPVVPFLAEALAAGALGAGTLIETEDGRPFTPKGFYGMMKRACIAAGLPHCSPHGLRKSAARRSLEAGCTDAEDISITGRKTVREYHRYAGLGARPEADDAAMGKIMANHTARAANARAQTVKDSG